jgi:S-adenosylmethionine:tRNA ribosyltransferase-isomerase
VRLSDFDFDLPPELIAQEPIPERDGSRLLSIDVDQGNWKHRRVSDFRNLLDPGDLLITNNSRVFPARLKGETESGASVEILLLQAVGKRLWEALARPAKRLRDGTRVVFGDGLLRAEVRKGADDGKRIIELEYQGDLFDICERIGRTPLPPYIKRKGGRLEALDRERYQTVYARDYGSIAAPTAGLHFTPDLLRALEERGVGIAEVTLHVGYGTFQPIRTPTIEEHRMESERYVISEATSHAIEETRVQGKRVVAVGTTTVRTLESAAGQEGKLQSGAGITRLFIYPGFRFQVVDALLTNFHLPRSSLFLLVSAFGGKELLRRAYEEAIRERYRFYSYGDCMFLSGRGRDAPC